MWDAISLLYFTPVIKRIVLFILVYIYLHVHMDRVKRIWYLSPMRAAKVQASLRGYRAVSPEPSLLAHTSSESRGTFRQKTRSLALLNCWPCAVKVCHDGMLEDTNSLDGAHIVSKLSFLICLICSSFSSLWFSILPHFYLQFKCILYLFILWTMVYNIHYLRLLTNLPISQ